MQESLLEFLTWFVVVVVVFYFLNNYAMLKRFASIIVAFLVASIIVFIAFRSILTELLVTITFVVFALYGLSEAIRAQRLDAKKGVGDPAEESEISKRFDKAFDRYILKREQSLSI